MSTEVENWRPVTGFEGCYEVSDMGQVRSLDRVVVQRATSRTREFERFLRGTVLRPAPNPRGYLHVGLKVGNTQYTRDVHVLVLDTFVGPCPSTAHEACHNNGDNSDNRLANLRWDTTSENALDRVRHGTNPWAAKRTCPRNHELALPNLVPSALKRGGRSCLACSRARAATRNASIRGRVERRTLQEISDAHYAEIMAAKEMAS